MVLLLLSACTASPSPAPVPAPAPPRTNIVFVLTDDLTPDLLRFMPHTRALAADGTTFTEYTVTDSLCCPSRASILSGKYPHNTGVFTNTAPDGGIAVFRSRGMDRSTFATDFQRAGYRTALYGKYLNGYTTRSGHIAPGWTDWAVPGAAGYGQFGYDMLENGTVVRYGHRPQDYLTDVLSAKTRAFVRDSAAARQPFLVTVSTISPHRPYTPAPRDAGRYPGLTAPRGPAFDRPPTAAPRWLSIRHPLTPAERARLDAAYRTRAQSVRAVDRLIGDLRATLTRAGVAGDTVVVFSSDNGYHLGEHRLMPGKQTAFDHDIHVPLIMAGPGIPESEVDAPAENIDLRPTFAALAGLPAPLDADGRSLSKVLGGAEPADWRTTALVEHHGPTDDPADPDFPSPRSGNPPTYTAIRTPAWTWIEYTGGFREYYNRVRDPHQLRNIASALPPARRAALHRRLTALAACRGPAACHAAGG